MADEPVTDPASLHVFGAGRFQNMSEVGAGAHAKVYRAYDTTLDRDVAIKKAKTDAIIDDLGGFQKLDDAGIAKPLRAYMDGLAHGGRSNYSLLREAQLLAQVQTPGVVSVFDVGQFEDGAVAIVMPIFVANEPLHLLSWRVVLDGVLQLAEGLSALHEFRILHRDIKPDNIVYDDAGRPCLADLGLACSLDDEALMNYAVGSSYWMAPELYLLAPNSVQTDIYSFCMVVFQMFYGFPPFPHSDAKIAGVVVELERKDQVPAALREALVKGLQPDPADRWATMDDLITVLRECVLAPDPKPRPSPSPESEPEPEPGPEPVKRARPWLAVAASVGVAAALGAGVWTAIPEARAGACDEVSRELEEVWDHDVQAELREALGSRLASAQLERAASRWLAVRAQECDMAKRADQPLLASPCSASVRDNFGAVIEALRSPFMRDGLDVGRVLAELPDPEYCLEHPEAGEYARGGLLGLRRLDVELRALLMSEQLEHAEQRQAEYMLAARSLGAEYDVARAIYWRGELHRQRGELDEAEAAFKRALAAASSLHAEELGGETMLKLAVVAGARGDWVRVDERASVAANTFAGRPDKYAEVLEVHGLALVESGPAERERGLALLRRAVATREVQHSQYRGSRAKVGRSMEALGRGLLTADRAEEALAVVKEALAIYVDELGGMSKDVHEVRRLVFVAQTKTGRMDDAFQLEQTLLDTHGDAKDWRKYVEEVLWMSSIYSDAEMPAAAVTVLDFARQVIPAHGLDDLTRKVDMRLHELGYGDVSPHRQDR